ncbi:uncharacterized protein LOC108327183 [Vigna angularis]|uniref:uncharacterized protein LOC108327183 n=1 Tax=Phaseolus angularis TaxID=3914 RepID=UPI00080A1F28|nr:uncharacterized protein LOC108327183 [Vigna angularis]
MSEKATPTFDKYDGSTDPDDHMRAFVNAMTFYSNSDPVLCRAFSLSLRGEALTWYNTLPPNTVDCFVNVQTLFERQYASSWIQEFTPAELVNTKQEKDESLKAFMQRYNETAQRVRDINHTFIISNLPSYLKAGYFSKNLYAKLPKTMDELQERVAEFIRIEDIRQSQKKQQQETSEGNKKEGKRSFNGDPPQKDPMCLPRFNDYTTLNAPRAKVLEEALNAELLTLREKATPKSASARKSCNFHLNRGHTTEECNILKDEIERLIRGGHLQQFIKKERNQTRSPTREIGRSHQKTERGHRHNRNRSRSCERDRSVRRYINTISGGFAGGGTSSSARKRHLRRLKTVHMVDRKSRSLPPITFIDEDFHAPQDDHIVITAEISRCVISKVLVDQGSSINILYWKTFLQMDLSEDAICPFNEQIVGFIGERVNTHGYLDLRTQLGMDREAKEFRIRFLLVEAHTPYNALLGQPCLNAFGSVVSTPHLALKFPSDKGTICTVRADQRTTRECYNASLKVTPFVPPQTDRGAEITTTFRDLKYSGIRPFDLTGTRPSALTGIQPLGLYRPSTMASSVQAFSRSASQISSTGRFFRNSWATNGHSRLLGDSPGTPGPQTVINVYWEVLQELLDHGRSLTSTRKFFRNSWATDGHSCLLGSSLGTPRP